MRRLLPLALLALAFTLPAAAQQHQHGGGAKPSRVAEGCGPTDGRLRCATAVTPALGPDRSLWLAWVAGGKVWAARSPAGQPTGPLGEPIPLSPEPARVDDNGDGRPTITVDAQNRVTVAWAVRKDERYNGQVLVSHAADGKFFTPPTPLVAGGTSERFPVLSSDGDGRLLATWIDKAPLAAAKAKGQAYAGAALKAAWSLDGGRTFQATVTLGDNSCECCRVALSWAGPGKPVITWRSIFEGGIRDHALLAFAAPDQPGPQRRVAVDNWKIDGCPHHGPALATSGGTIHVAWFTQGTARDGLFYARSTDNGASFTTPAPVGNPDRQPGHAQLLAQGDRLWLAWKEYDGKESQIMAQTSPDGGKTWSTARSLANTADASDHPILLADGKGGALLSWQTKAEGYRLIPVGDAP